MTALCVSAFPHYFPIPPSFLHASILIMPHLACSVTCVMPICLGAMAMLPLAGFAHSLRSLAWSLSVWVHHSLCGIIWHVAPVSRFQ